MHWPISYLALIEPVKGILVHKAHPSHSLDYIWADPYKALSDHKLKQGARAHFFLIWEASSSLWPFVLFDRFSLVLCVCLDGLPSGFFSSKKHHFFLLFTFFQITNFLSNLGAATGDRDQGGNGRWSWASFVRFSSVVGCSRLRRSR